MKIKRIVSFEESLELSKMKSGAHYWHDRLSADFITQAGRMYDRLKGIDDWVERASKQHWVDEFRTEQRPEDALAIYAECLAAVSKLKRKCGGLGQMQRKGVYYLALARSHCQDGEEAFRLTREYHGFTFTDSEKKPIMRIVDSCVRYHPIVYEHDVVPASALHFGAERFGKGKSRNPFLGSGSSNN